MFYDTLIALEKHNKTLQYKQQWRGNVKNALRFTLHNDTNKITNAVAY